ARLVAMVNGVAPGQSAPGYPAYPAPVPPMSSGALQGQPQAPYPPYGQPNPAQSSPRQPAPQPPTMLRAPSLVQPPTLILSPSEMIGSGVGDDEEYDEAQPQARSARARRRVDSEEFRPWDSRPIEQGDDEDWLR
ncbi:MAG TPA: hypothetical protein VKQ36_08225, partial [Ktedonobacterales bacterium]|nr:hypothetical protein [Ktedonobacterales bacterium]